MHDSAFSNESTYLNSNRTQKKLDSMNSTGEKNLRASLKQSESLL